MKPENARSSVCTRPEVVPHEKALGGANRGIGREIASQLAHLGAARNPYSPQQGESRSCRCQIGHGEGSRTCAPLDGTDPASVTRPAADLGRVDVLVNNAGAYYDTVDETSTADLTSV